MRMTGYSRTQCMRLILQYRKHGCIRRKSYKNQTSFKKDNKYLLKVLMADSHFKQSEDGETLRGSLID